MQVFEAPFTIADAIKHGYMEYQNHHGHPEERLLQKLLWKDGSKKYFVNLYFGDFTHPNGKQRWLYTYATVRLFREGSPDFELKVMPEKGHTLADVERLVEDAYQKLGCIPDTHNN